MKRIILLFIAIVAFFQIGSAQIVCIYCFNTNDSISNNVTNLVVNGSMENTTCIPNSNSNTFCPNSVNYNCDINNWTCTGGGTSTYCQIFTNVWSLIPDGNNAAYFGNNFCNPCSANQNDTSCINKNNCEVTGIPPGFPTGPVAYGGGTGLSLEQTVTGLTVGATYVLEFWAGGEDFGAFPEEGMFGLDIGFGYTLLTTVPTGPNTIGRTYIIIWNATSTSHTLKWTNWGHICSSCSELTLDHVRLYPVSQLDPSVNPCVSPSLAVTVTPTQPSCNGTCDGEITANPTSGTQPYSYLWSNGMTTQTITGLCAGPYTVTVTDATGDTAVATTSLANPPLFFVSLTSTISLCNGATGTATATPGGGVGPFSYLWSPSGQVTQVATNLPPGLHSVTVTDAGGCTATGSVVVGQTTPPDPSFVLVSGGSCLNGAPYIFNATGNNPIGTTYSWTFQNGTPSTATGPNAQTNFTLGGAHTVTLVVANGPCSDSSRQVITIAGLPVPNAGLDVSFCEGEGGALLNGSATGGTAPYYYSWSCNLNMTAFCGLDSVFDDDPLANPSSTAWFYLQVTGADGCVSPLDSVLVTILEKPIVDVGPDVAICQQPAPGALISATVLNPATAPGPYTILWTPNTGLNNNTIFTPFARPDTTTIYTAVVTSSNGCSSALTTVDTLSSLTVVVNPRPIADAGPDIDACLGDSTIIQGLGYGAGPVYAYEWSPWDGLNDPTLANPTASPAFTHQYILTTWSNGCPSIGDTMTLWVHTTPTPSAGPIQEICVGEFAQLDAFGAGDSSAFYTYLWTPAATLNDATAENPLANPDTTTVYELIVTSSWGCSSPVAQVQVTVRPTPIADAGPNFTICEGDSLHLQGSYGYLTTEPADPSQVYYAWIPASTLDDTTALQPWATPTQSTMYILDVRYTLCHTQDSMLVSVIPTELPTALADTNVICSGHPVQFHASGGLGNAIFTWTPAAGLDDPHSPNPFANPDSSTIYQLTMQEGGCVTKAEIDLQVIPSPVVSFVSSSLEGCSPFPMSFISSSENTIHHIWNFGDGTPVSNEAFPMHTYADAGMFTTTLIGVGVGGCADTASQTGIHVIAPIQTDFSMAPAGSPTQTSVPLELFLPKGSVVFQDLSDIVPTEWWWDFGDGQLSDDVNPTHDYLQPGTYFVTLTTINSFGCIGKAEHGPIIIGASDLFIPNVFSPNGDGINDVFHIQYQGSQPFTVQIFDRWGILVHSTNNKEIGWKGLNQKSQEVPEGVYYYSVRVGDKEYTGPVTLLR